MTQKALKVLDLPTITRKTCKNMDHLPLSNIPMLVSSINFLLRDREFEDLDEICNYYNVQRATLESLLQENGYEYSEQYRKIL